MIPLNGVKKKGLDPQMDYEAIIVDNNDPQTIGQVKARIMGLMDDLRDEDLPWLRPVPYQPEGLKATGTGTLFGFLCVPQRGGKVTVKFPTGNIEEGLYEPTARMNESEALPEGQINYPHRIVLRISNGTQLIIDRSTNEMFLNMAGDYNMTVMGDVNQTIIGNQQLIVGNSKDDIPDYIRNDPVMTPNSLTPDPKGRIAFKGKSSGRSGNQYTHIKGNQTVVVDGNRTTTIKGKDTLNAKELGFESGGDVQINGQSVRLN